jgi:hypothetical protein
MPVSSPEAKRRRPRIRRPKGQSVFLQNLSHEEPNGARRWLLAWSLLRGLVRRLVNELGRPAMKHLIIDHRYFRFSIHWYQRKYYFFPRTERSPIAFLPTKRSLPSLQFSCSGLFRASHRQSVGLISAASSQQHDASAHDSVHLKLKQKLSSDITMAQRAAKLRLRPLAN